MKYPGLSAIVIGLILPTLFLLFPSTLCADTFVSFNGQFYFSYPETWMQIDYTTAEYYLTRGKPDQAVDFEAVFSVEDTEVLFKGQYLILTVDTLGGLTPEQIDSVVAVTSEEFKRPVKEVSSDVFLTASVRDSILFDRTAGLLAIETEVSGDETGDRINLLVMKFYPRGIANFYFYAPTADYFAALPDYRNMIVSFSTESIDKALGRDSVKIAETKGEMKASTKYLIAFAGLIVVALVILAARGKRTKK